ncbi:MAG: hypothetical protein ACRED0_12540 [Gammaproteobacteria bacterium]
MEKKGHKLDRRLNQKRLTVPVRDAPLLDPRAGRGASETNQRKALYCIKQPFDKR